MLQGLAKVPPSRRWADLTTSDFDCLDMSRCVAVQPVSAIEQHGPHLPVCVDAAIGDGIVARAIEGLDDDQNVLVLPSLVIGKSDEHHAFPGTLSLSHETLARVWFEIGESVSRTGCRRLVFVNSHGGQTALIDIVCRDLRVKLGMLAINATWFSMVDVASYFGELEARHGIHGGAAETSMMMHLHADTVRLSEIRNFVPITVDWEKAGAALTAEGAVSFGWQAQDLHASGACGNAAAASADAGRGLIEESAAALVALLREVEAFPLANFRHRTADASIRRAPEAAAL